MTTSHRLGHFVDGMIWLKNVMKVNLSNIWFHENFRAEGQVYLSWMSIV